MSSKNKLFIICFVVGVFSTYFAVAFAQNQPRYQLHISSIETPQSPDKNWYGRPVTVNYLVRWELYAPDTDGKLQQQEFREIPEYRLYCSQLADTHETPFSRPEHLQQFTVHDTDRLALAPLRVGPRYYFRVEGIRNGSVVVQSDTAWAVSGKPRPRLYSSAPGAVGNGKATLGIPIPFPWPVRHLFGLYRWPAYDKVYDDSTYFGKVSFVLIEYFFIAGIFFIFPLRSFKYLRLGRIFPFRPLNTKQLTWRSFTQGNRFTRYYENRLSLKFRFLVEAWECVIRTRNDKLREVSKTKNKEDSDRENYEYWRTTGDGALELLEKIIFHNPGTSDEKKSRAFEKILDKSIKDNEKFCTLLKGDIIESDVQELNWQEVRQEILQLKTKFKTEKYPIVKIMTAGLANHRLNGYHWQEASAEVDRAIENRATAEIELLKRHSMIDWLWNLGALAPLLGLLGTVTGISQSFEGLNTLPEGTSHLALVHRLSGGVFEALWTTIFGLITGIILMLIYYYYNNRLEWIYGKWQGIFAHITEKI